MHTIRLNLLMQGSIENSKIQVVTHYWQRISSLQYLLQMQVQAQQRYPNIVTQGMIPYSNTTYHNLNLQNQFQFSHSQTWTRCMISPKGFPLLSNQQWLQFTQDDKVIHKRGICHIFSHSSNLIMRFHNLANKTNTANSRCHMHGSQSAYHTRHWD